MPSSPQPAGVLVPAPTPSICGIERKRKGGSANSPTSAPFSSTPPGIVLDAIRSMQSGPTLARGGSEHATP